MSMIPSIDLVILAAGRMAADGGVGHLWLAEHNHRTFIEHLVQASSALRANRIFAVMEQDARKYRLGSILSLIAPGAAVVQIKGPTKGAACTALLCVQHITDDRELLIVNSNEFLDLDFADPVAAFRRENLDAGVVTFDSVHPRYSYVKLGSDGFVVEAAEKRPISRNAVAGFFWFKKGADFVQAAKDIIRKDASIDGDFFVSLTLNELVLKHLRIGTYGVDSQRYWPLKSERQIRQYEGQHED